LQAFSFIILVVCCWERDWGWLMSLLRRILVVDDHFETLSIMRAMLEGAAGRYWVRTVPSGEEGMLEMRQGGYDLLITDVRLPGMSGIELVRQVRKTQRDLPVIMITGYVSVNGEEEARALGVWHYFTKPVAGDVLLTAVHSALSQPPTTNSELPQIKPEATVESPLQQRLEMLQAETGAQGLLLVGIDGAVVFAEMAGMGGQAWEGVVAPLTQLMRSSLELGTAAGSEESFTLQYHDLSPFKLTSASVGTEHFVALFFDAESRRSRIGTVWLFVQRAIADLLGLLTDPPAVVVAALAADLPVAERVAVPTAVSVPTLPPPVAPSEPELSAAELGQLLGLDMNETAVPEDLDSFWSQAMSETESKKAGMSLAEAQRQGIIPSGLTFEEEVES
jgi:CheY-like chemotaxis protein